MLCYCGPRRHALCSAFTLCATSQAICASNHPLLSINSTSIVPLQLYRSHASKTISVSRSQAKFSPAHNLLVRTPSSCARMLREVTVAFVARPFGKLARSTCEVAPSVAWQAWQWLPSEQPDKSPGMQDNFWVLVQPLHHLVAYERIESDGGPTSTWRV